MIENYATTGTESVLVRIKIGTLDLVALLSDNRTETASTNKIKDRKQMTYQGQANRASSQLSLLVVEHFITAEF